MNPIENRDAITPTHPDDLTTLRAEHDQAEHTSVYVNAESPYVQDNECGVCLLDDDALNALVDTVNHPAESRDTLRADTFSVDTEPDLSYHDEGSDEPSTNESSEPNNHESRDIMTHTPEHVNNELDKAASKIIKVRDTISRAADKFNDPVCREYLGSRGFTADDLDCLRAFRIGLYSFKKKIDGEFRAVNAIVIPHGDTYYTARAIDKNIDKKNRFICNASTPVQLFNLNAVIDNDIFAITEGAFDALSLSVCGLPAVALGGVGSNHKSLVNLIKSVEHPVAAVIAFDNDNAGHSSADKIKHRLDAIGIPSARLAFDSDANDAFVQDRQALTQKITEVKASLAPKKPITHIALTDTITAPPSTGKHSADANTQSSVEEQARARRMIDFIDPSLPYDEWIAVAAACKSVGLSFEVFDSWSRHSSKYDQAVAEKTWNGMHGQKHSIGTIHRLAKRGGYSEANFRAESVKHETNMLIQDRTPVIDDEELISIALLRKKQTVISSKTDDDDDDAPNQPPFVYSRFGADDLHSLFVEGNISKYNGDIIKAARRLAHVLCTFADNNLIQIQSLLHKSKFASVAKLDDDKIRAICIDVVNQHNKTNAPIFNQIKFKMKKSSKHPKLPLRTYNNVLLAFRDPVLDNAFAFNAFAHRIEPTRLLPWRKDFEQHAPIGDIDYAHIRNYIGTQFELQGKEIIDDVLIERARQLWFHPVHDFFNSLPHWDHKPRAESLFIDYLGVVDTHYARAVTKHWLLAAVARVFHPACKWDYCIVLQGKQGIGKSTLLRKLGGAWFGELDSIQDDDVVERIQGLWIIELPEMQATKKADIEYMKAFVSRQEDRMRLKYGRRTEVFPRQCVLAATTNDAEFLRDQTGSRRFLILECKAESIGNILTDDCITQIWAEMFHFYHQTFPAQFQEQLLDIPDDIKAEAAVIQEIHTEGSDMQSSIEAHLDVKIPAPMFWRLLNKLDRRKFFSFGKVRIPFNRLSKDDQAIYASCCVKLPGEGEFLIIDPNGEHAEAFNFDYRQEVSPAEIASELLGIDNYSRERITTRQIRAILDKLDGWQYCGRAKNVDPVYGRQRHCYMRKHDDEKARADTDSVIIPDQCIPF